MATTVETALGLTGTYGPDARITQALEGNHDRRKETAAYRHQSRRDRGRQDRSGTGVGRAIFDFALRGKGERNAFIDMGDQFVNMTLVADYAVNGVEKRHLGFVVDDRSRIIDPAKAAGVRSVEGPFLDFLDRGGTGSRSSSIRTSSSPRHRT